MSEITVSTTIENYKGLLQQYCQARHLQSPVYETTQQGPPNEPSWVVAVKYGQSTYMTSEPIHGSKRFAEHIAAKQILETIESRQEAFLAGEPHDEDLGLAKLNDSAPELPSVELASEEGLSVPIELVTNALGIANHRLSELRRGTRYRESESNQAFARNLADLTMLIVREVANAAVASRITLDYPREG